MNFWVGVLLGSISWFLLIWLLISAARQVLGVRVGFLRGLVCALVGWVIAGSIVQALPAIHDVGTAIALLVPIAGSALLGTMLSLLVGEFVRPSGQGWGVRSWPGALRRRWRRGRRYATIMHIAVRHGLGGYLGGRSGDADSPHRRMRLARSLREALEEAGVTFVKLGQVLSTRSDLLPPEYVTELSKLQHRAATADNASVLLVLREELGENAFAAFTEQPLAAASIAQVYSARTADGTHVAVKVQRPGIRDIVEQDLDILVRVARSLRMRADWARRIGVVELADGFAAALTEELDFTVEAKNLEAVRAASPRDDVRLPRLINATERVLVTERLYGVPLGSAADVDRAPKYADALLRSMLRQVMVHGVFHADPHPGNVIVLDDGALGLLDFGSVGRIDSSLREGLRAFLMGVDAGDPAAMRDALLEVLVRPDEIDEQRLERALGRLAAQHFTGDAMPDVRLFTDLFALISRYGLAVPPEIAAVFRALATLEGTLGHAVARLQHRGALQIVRDRPHRRGVAPRLRA